MSKKVVEKTENGIPYEYETAGSAGCRYYLMVNKGQFTHEEIEAAKSWIRSNFDAVTITVEKNVYTKSKGQLK